MLKLITERLGTINLFTCRSHNKWQISRVTLPSVLTTVLFLFLYAHGFEFSDTFDSSINGFTHLWVNGDTGDDQNPGTSPSKPLKTIQKAVSISTYGYTIHIAETKKPYSEYVKIDKGANESKKPLVLKGEGRKVVIDPDYKVPAKRWYGIIRVCNSSNVRIENIELRRSFWAGIFADSVNNLSITNVRTEYTNSSGIYVRTSKKVSIESCRIKDACEFDECIDTLPQECISVVSVDSFLVKNCAVYRTRDGMDGGKNYGGEGIDLKGSSRNGLVINNYVYDLGVDVAIYAGNVSAGNVDSMDGTWNVDICRNYVTRAGTGIAVSSEVDGFVSSIFIYNNVIFNVAHSGIVVTKWNGPQTGTKHNIVIAFNTVFKAGMKGEGGIAVQCRNSELAAIVVANNIVSECNGFQLRIDKCALDVTSMYKNILYDRNGNYHKHENEIPPYSNLCEECIGKSPVFLFTICPQLMVAKKRVLVPEDFNLSCKSPGFETGTPVSQLENHPNFKLDYSGKNRLSDDNCDGMPEYEIGALEYLINGCDRCRDCKAENLDNTQAN